MSNHLTVGYLKQALDKVPDDMIVLVASDGEGNSFKSLGAAEVNYALDFDDSQYEYDIVSEDDVDFGDGNAEYSEEEVTQVFVIWP